jgi:hypothetical protein
MIVRFSQIILFCETKKRLKVAIPKPKINQLSLQTAYSDRKMHKIEKKMLFFKQIRRQKCCRNGGYNGKTRRKYLQKKRRSLGGQIQKRN